MPVHNIPPVWDENSKVLILGSFPSPRSRADGFFYAHPQNRFWKALAAVFDEEVPQGKDERKAFTLQHGIALWDVIGSCDIQGASDASVKNAIPNDFSLIGGDIRAVFTTGKLATALYQEKTGKPSRYLPSPSPANRATSFEKLVEAYAEIKKFL